MVCVQSERQHAAESALHLLYGDVMSLVAFQSGICHKADTLYSLEILRHTECIFVVLTHPERQSYRTTHDEPCVKRADGRT